MDPIRAATAGVDSWPATAGVDVAFTDSPTIRASADPADVAAADASTASSALGVATPAEADAPAAVTVMVCRAVAEPSDPDAPDAVAWWATRGGGQGV